MTGLAYSKYIEQTKVGFGTTDVTFHSRDFRPTQSFERAKLKAQVKGSKVIRVYGIPRLVIDPKTKLVYLGIQFSEDIVKRIRSGELAMTKGTPWITDQETQNKLDDKEKRKLKNLTRFWRKGR